MKSGNGKNIKKAFTYFIGVYFVISGVLISGGNVLAGTSALQFTPQITIPNTNITGTLNVGSKVGTKMVSTLLPTYIGAFYQYGLTIVGIIATVMLMAGGIVWLTSAGNDSKVTQAKEMIFSSLAGIFLLYGAYLILNTINPDLVKLKAITVINIEKKEISDASILNGAAIPSDTEFGHTCTNGGMTCSDSIPPTMNIDYSNCVKKYGQTEWSQFITNCHKQGTDYHLWCCGKSDSAQKDVDSQCEGAENFTDCKSTLTSTASQGYCWFNKCERKKLKGEKCVADRECQSWTNESGKEQSPSCDKVDGQGYCAGLIGNSTNGCENEIGGGCRFDDCCSGLCCSSGECRQGERQSGSDKCK